MLKMGRKRGLLARRLEGLSIKLDKGLKCDR
jgi:hypothetical protein